MGGCPGAKNSGETSLVAEAKEGWDDELNSQTDMWGRFPSHPGEHRNQVVSDTCWDGKLSWVSVMRPDTKR